MILLATAGGYAPISADPGRHWPAVAPEGFGRLWRWRVNLPARHGQRCRVVARGAMNSALIEFLDGERHVVSRYAFRKAP